MSDLDETVTVGGAEYVISGIPFGTVPAWQLIRRDGKQLAGADFEALPPADQQQLVQAVRAYINKLNGEG